MRFLILSLFAIYFTNPLHAVEVTERSVYRKYLTETDFDKHNSWTGNVFAALGYRNLNSGDFDPVHEQSNSGFMFDIGRREWPLHICLDYFSSDASESAAGQDFDIEINEIDLGLRFVMDIPESNVTWQTGAGIAFIDVEESINGLTDEASTHGFWLSTGGYYRFQGRFSLGLDIRYTDARSRLFAGTSDNVGNWQTNLIFGLRF